MANSFCRTVSITTKKYYRRISNALLCTFLYESFGKRKKQKVKGIMGRAKKKKKKGEKKEATIIGNKMQVVKCK